MHYISALVSILAIVSSSYFVLFLVSFLFFIFFFFHSIGRYLDVHWKYFHIANWHIVCASVSFSVLHKYLYAFRSRISTDEETTTRVRRERESHNHIVRAIIVAVVSIVFGCSNSPERWSMITQFPIFFCFWYGIVELQLTVALELMLRFHRNGFCCCCMQMLKRMKSTNVSMFP